MARTFYGVFSETDAVNGPFHWEIWTALSGGEPLVTIATSDDTYATVAAARRAAEEMLAVMGLHADWED
jgi:hypothetical protein